MLYSYIDPVAFSLGPLHVRWYGIAYLVGFISVWWLGHKRLNRLSGVITANQFDDFLFQCILGVIVGGRLGHVIFYQNLGFLHDPLSIIRIWEGGMSFHGGLAGVFLGAWFYTYRHNISLWAMADFVIPFTPIGLGLGRIGNFINGELWGSPTDLSWGVRVPCARFPLQCTDLMPDALWSRPLHPSQLYEAILEGVLLFILLWWFSSTPRPKMAVTGLFLCYYAVVRCLVELVRQPDSQLGYLAFGWLTMGQVLSIPMLALGVLLLVLAYKNNAVVATGAPA